MTANEVGEAQVFLSVVVPAYNEVDGINHLVMRVVAVLDGLDGPSELLVVDDASSDGTGERLDELAEQEPNLRVLHFAENRGQSAALAAGFQHARGRFVAMLDADLQTYPEDLPKLIDILESQKLDAVVGIRAERHDSGWKRFSSRFANGVRNRLTREDIHDTGCPIKVFRTEAIRSVRFFVGTHRFLPTLLRMEGYTVKQVPVRHTERTSGTSKYGTWDRAFSGLRDALGVRWLQDRHMKWKLRE
jgi:glycosyltransferase involved in cell wall biosynthesis